MRSSKKKVKGKKKVEAASLEKKFASKQQLQKASFGNSVCNLGKEGLPKTKTGHSKLIMLNYVHLNFFHDKGQH